MKIYRTVKLEELEIELGLAAEISGIEGDEPFLVSLEEIVSETSNAYTIEAVSLMEQLRFLSIDFVYTG